MVESHREEIAKLEALYAGNPGGRVFVHLAEAYRKAGEHERARRILDEGLARHTDSASGFVVLGRVLADMAITDEAETAFRRVLELDGGNLVALRWLGDLARQQGRSGEAAAHYRELLIRNPSNEEVRDLVEIVEREAGAPLAGAATGEGQDAGEDEPAADFEVSGAAGGEAPAGDEAPAADDLAGPVAEVVPEPEPVVGEPPDTEPWSAAPGGTGEVEEPPVEFGLIELEVETAAPASEPSADEPDEAGDFDIVTSVDPDDAAAVADFGGDDEAAPVEIHLLDPAFEPSEVTEEEDDFVSEIDLSDMAAAGRMEDEGDYADADFVADLTAGMPEEQPEEDMAPPDAAFTLLPDEELPAGEARPAEESAGSPFAEGLTFEPAVPAAEQADETARADAATEESVRSAPEGGDADADRQAGDTGIAALAGAARPAAEARPPEVRREADSGLVTETMAVLYRSQGFHDRAADVYRSLLRARPGDERLTAKLREAEAAAAAAAGAAEAREQARGEDEAGEVWLRGVGAAWTAGDTAGGETTPYAWTPEPDEAEAADPIGSYLRELVTWRAGRAPAQDPGMVSDRPAATAPQAAPDADTIPDWLTDPGASREWANSPPEPAPQASPEVAPAAAAPGFDEPWAEAPAGEPAAEPGEVESAGVEPPAGATAQGEPDAAPVAAGADLGWTPDELDRDAGRGQDTPAAPEAAATSSDSSDDDGAEDEDLEMFRSWLQSLKK